MKRTILILFLIMSIGISAEETLFLKNPYLSGSLSWYYPGLGQIYNGKVFKGSVMFILETTCLYLSLNLVSDLTFRIEEGFIVNPHSEITDKNRALSVTFFSAAVLLHVYNIIDAIGDSLKYNTAFAEKAEKPKYDPLVPAVFSFFMPGSGQMLNGDYRKGSELIFYEVLFKLWKVYIDYDLRKRYAEDSGAINWLDLSNNDRITFFSYFMMHFLLRSYCAYDAFKKGAENLKLSMDTDTRNNPRVMLGFRF